MDKDKVYQQLTAQAKSLVDGVDNVVGALGNVAALLKEELPSFFWVGFYVVKEGSLQLGPFQGPVACYKIDVARLGKERRLLWCPTCISSPVILPAPHAPIPR